MLDKQDKVTIVVSKTSSIVKRLDSNDYFSEREKNSFKTAKNNARCRGQWTLTSIYYSGEVSNTVSRSDSHDYKQAHSTVDAE